LLLPGVASARTVGISVNDSITYAYTIHTTYATPNGNHTQDQHNEFTLKILSVAPQAALGEIGYTETVTLLNDSSLTTTQAAQNITTIFDPYNNDTYLGNIGFYPFTYTDLAAGSVNDLKVSLTVTSSSSGPLSGTQSVNATVMRNPTAIAINFTILSAPGVPKSLSVLDYNASTGLLTHAVTFTHFFGVEKDFIYNLVSYVSAKPSGPDYPPYLIPTIVVAVIAVVAVVAILTRPSPRQRKAEKIRRKMGRSAFSSARSV
jgi:hypothetical protein